MRALGRDLSQLEDDLGVVRSLLAAHEAAQRVPALQAKHADKGGALARLRVEQDEARKVFEQQLQTAFDAAQAEANAADFAYKSAADAARQREQLEDRLEALAAGRDFRDVQGDRVHGRRGHETAWMNVVLGLSE